MTVTHLRHGRAYCAQCHRVRSYVAHAEVLELHCPTCGALCVQAHQDDTEERATRPIPPP